MDHTTHHDFCTHAKTHLRVNTHNSVKHSDLGLLQMMQVENKEGFKSRSRGSAASTTQVGASGTLSLYHRHSRETSPPHLPFWILLVNIFKRYEMYSQNDTENQKVAECLL